MHKSWHTEYINKAHRWVSILQFIPGVQALFLSGSLATGTATKQSDIDLFIVTKPHMLYITRLFMNGLLLVTGNLAKPQHHAGTLCPNHFVATTALALREQNPYVAKLVYCMQPLYDPYHTHEHFLYANMDLLIEYGYSAPPQPEQIYRPKNPCFVIRRINNSLRSIMQWKIHQNASLPARHGILLGVDEIRLHQAPRTK